MNGVSLIVDGDGAASAIVPSVSGRSPGGRRGARRAGARRAMTAASAPPTMAARISERGARAAVVMVTKRHPCSELSTAPGSCPAPGNPALSGRRASNRASILRGMTSVANRTFGAQSMTAPLREVLVKAPGPAFGRAFDDPAHGFLRPVDLDLARREHDGLVVGARPASGSRVHVLDAETDDDPDLVYVFDPLLIADGGAIPLRPGQAEPRGRARRARGVDARRAASRRSAASRRPAPSRAATRSGFAPTCCASGGRCGPTTPAPASSPRSSAATSACSTSRTGRDRPSSSTCCRSSRPSPTTSRSCSCRCCPPACTRSWPTSGSGWSRCPRRSTRRSAATCSRSGPGSWSSRRATTARGAGSRRPACEVHAIPLGEVGENGSGGVTCLTRPILRG